MFILLALAIAFACADEGMCTTKAACAEDVNIVIEPLTGTLGAIVHGVNISTEQSDAIIAQIRSALLTYRVLFFKQQFITPTQQVSFARRFGTLTPAHPLVGGLDADHPEVLKLDSTDYPLGVGSRNSKTSYNNRWHTDVTFSATPPALSVLSGVRIPPRGGDTLWCDLVDAYATLSQPLQVMLDNLTAIHSIASTFSRFQQDDLDGNNKQRASNVAPVRHPVIRVHPETNEKTLFVNPTFTNYIEQFSPEESRAVLDLLYAHSILPERTVRWHWTAGDVAMWDNQATSHYASADYTEPRLMYRVTVAGDRPFGPSGASN